MSLHYNEEELQWEGVVSLNGQDVSIIICNDFQKAQIESIAEDITNQLQSEWHDITSSITGEFLESVNQRRLFLKQQAIDVTEYGRSLHCESLFVMEEKACELVFNDQGLSGNAIIVVYIGSDGSIRAPVIDDWEEERQIRGERVNVSVCNDFPPESIESVIREVEATINELWHDVENVLVKHLLSMYNEKWREPEIINLISRQEFMARIQLSGVHIMEDKAFDLYFLDNDLFAGHYIELFVDSDGSLYEPSLYR